MPKGVLRLGPESTPSRGRRPILVILDSGYGGSGTVSLTLRLGVVSISYVFTEKRIEPLFNR